MDGSPHPSGHPWPGPPTAWQAEQPGVVVAEPQIPPPPPSSAGTAHPAPSTGITLNTTTLSAGGVALNSSGANLNDPATFAAFPFPPAEYPLPPRSSAFPANSLEVSPSAQQTLHVEPPPAPRIPRRMRQQYQSFSVQPHGPSTLRGSSETMPSHRPNVYFSPPGVPIQGSWTHGMQSPFQPYGTSPGLMLGMHDGSTLTPWPPVALRHVDSYLAGTYAPVPPYPAPQAPAPSSQASVTDQRRDSTLSASYTCPLEYPISNARSAAALAAAEATYAAQVEVSTRAGDQFDHLRQDRPQGEPLTPISPPQSDFGSFSMASMTGWSFPSMQPQHPGPQQVPMQPLAVSPRAPEPASLEADPHTSPSSRELCTVPGCDRAIFCELSPCGCRLCRDHLGWVIRGVRTLEIDEQGEEDMSESAAPSKTIKVFRCAACRTESSSAGPTLKPTSLSHRGSLSEGRRASEPVIGLGLIGLDAPGEDQAHNFSIKYFSAGPAPFAHRSPSPGSAIHAHDIDLSTALDPTGDASLVQHLPTLQPPFEAHPATSPRHPSPREPQAQTVAALTAVDVERDDLQSREEPHVTARVLSPDTAAPTAMETHKAGLLPVAPPILCKNELRRSSSTGQLVAEEAGGGTETGSLTAMRPASAQPALEGGAAAISALPAGEEPDSEISRPTSYLPTVYAADSFGAALVAEPQPIVEGGLLEQDTMQLGPPSFNGRLSATSHGPSQNLGLPTRPNLASPSRLASSTQDEPERESPSEPERQPFYAVQPHPDYTFPHMYSDATMSPTFAQQRATHSYTHAGQLSAPFTLLPAVPYTSFPPGSVSLQPLRANHPHVIHASVPPGMALQPVLAALPPAGKKRNSLPPVLTLAPVAGADSPRSTARTSGAYGGSFRGGRGGASGRAGRSSLPASATFPPRQPPTLDPSEDGSRLELGGWPIVKVENIPFHTRVEDIENWLPDNYLPPENECLQPIHIILHRATGRTLPHCYLEIVNMHRATELIQRMDRSQLGDRTVRVKWERAGELMRDLFAQEAYFQMGHMGPGGQGRLASPAAAPLPHLPPEGFRIPPVLLTLADLSRLIGFTHKLVTFRERPYERAFYNAATLINKFPWRREDLWDAMLRDAMYELTLQMLKKAVALAAMDSLFFKSGTACPVFSSEQKAALSDAFATLPASQPNGSQPTVKRPRFLSSPNVSPSKPTPGTDTAPSMVDSSMSEPEHTLPGTPEQAKRPTASIMPLTPESPTSPLASRLPPFQAPTGYGRAYRGRAYRQPKSYRMVRGSTAEQDEGEAEGAGDQASGPSGKEWVALSEAGAPDDKEGEGGNDGDVSDGETGSAGFNGAVETHTRGWSGSTVVDNSPTASTGPEIVAKPSRQVHSAEPALRLLSPLSFPPLPIKSAPAAIGLATPPASPEAYRSGMTLREA